MTVLMPLNCTLEKGLNGQFDAFSTIIEKESGVTLAQAVEQALRPRWGQTDLAFPHYVTLSKSH